MQKTRKAYQASPMVLLDIVFVPSNLYFSFTLRPTNGLADSDIYPALTQHDVPGGGENHTRISLFGRA